MRAHTLVVAPHSDDAAMSVGGILLLGLLPRPVGLATIFTRSNYTLLRRTANVTDDVTATRKAEEARFATAIGACWLDLDLPEATLRGYGTLREVFGPRHRADGIQRAVMLSLRSAVKELQPSLVVLPLALGGHVDHVITCEVGRRVARLSKVHTAFYEDLPYAARFGATVTPAPSERLSPPLRSYSFDITRVLDAKVRAIAAYATQVGPKELQAVRTHALGLGSLCDRALERLWTNAPSSALQAWAPSGHHLTEEQI